MTHEKDEKKKDSPVKEALKAVAGGAVGLAAPTAAVLPAMAAYKLTDKAINDPSLLDKLLSPITKRLTAHRMGAKIDRYGYGDPAYGVGLGPFGITTAVNSLPSTSEATIAHEMGHARNAQLLGHKNYLLGHLLANKLMGITGPVAAIYSGAAEDPSYAPALLHLAANAPSLLDESTASLRALAHMIGRHGVGKGTLKSLHLLPAFGTYAAHAGAPLGLAALKKHLHKKKREREEGEKKAGLEKQAIFPLLAGAGIAGGAYKALRRFRPSNVPELAALQRQAQDKNFQVATSAEKGRGVRSALFGARDVPHQPLAGEAELHPEKTILHHTPSAGSRRGGVNVNAGVLPEALDDKWLFHQLMSQGTGGPAGLEGAVANTHRLDRALREVGGDPRKLIRLMGEQGYVIKPRTGSMSKAENLLTHETDVNAPRMRAALQNPENFIIQEKLPISREFRVHMVNNVPVTAAHRQLPHEGLRKVWDKHMGGGGGAFVPVLGSERDRLMQFARDATKHLGVTPEGNNILGDTENLHHALDIAQLPDGSFKLIESNPTPGTFMNPVVNRKVQQAITGRLPSDVAALGALGLGGLGALGTRALLRPKPAPWYQQAWEKMPAAAKTLAPAAALGLGGAALLGHRHRHERDDERD